MKKMATYHVRVEEEVNDTFRDWKKENKYPTMGYLFKWIARNWEKIVKKVKKDEDL